MNGTNYDLGALCVARKGRRGRASSYDRTGGNDDRVYVKPGETYVFADMKKPGCITHIWATLANEGFTVEKNCYRKVVLEFYWDGEKTPSVECPSARVSPLRTTSPTLTIGFWLMQVPWLLRTNFLRRYS